MVLGKVRLEVYKTGVAVVIGVHLESKTGSHCEIIGMDTSLATPVTVLG